MKKHIYNSLIAFFGGLLGVSVIFIIFHLISHIGQFEHPFLLTPLGIFLYYLLVISLTEEGVKFLLIKRDIGQFPYGFLLGLGFGIGETALVYPSAGFGWVPGTRTPAILLHIITAGILSYAIKKNKPLSGLLIAITLHTGFNLVSHYSGTQ